MSARSGFLRILVRSKFGLFGLGVILFFVLLAIFAPYIAPFNPMSTSSFNVAPPFSSPSWFALLNSDIPPEKTYGILGTDEIGRDIFSQVVYGSRISMTVGLLAAGLSLVAGLAVGLICGYWTGVADTILMRFTDVLITLPILPLLIVFAALFGPSIWNTILVIGLLMGWTGTARIMRSQVLTVKERAYVKVARSLGGGDLYIIRRHILPNITPLLFATATIAIRAAILSEAGLSFLGLGDPNLTSWGMMLFHATQSRAVLIPAWAYFLVPGICISLTVLGFTFIGHVVNEYLNPKLRGRRGGGGSKG